MMNRLIGVATALLVLVGCSEDQTDFVFNPEGNYSACVEVETSSALSRAYDADLKWSWEADDELTAYQVAGQMTRNTMTFVEANRFRCADFQYTTQDPASFHFIYPAADEQVAGELTAVQDGTWRPVAVATVQNATVSAIGHVAFEPLSSALEVRVWNEDKTTRRNITKAVLVSESDFVGKWMVQNDLSYVQTLSGKEIAIEGLDTDVVTFNMPVNEAGVAKDALQLTLTDHAGNTTTVGVPALTFVKGKRTILNVAFTLPTFTCATYNVDGLSVVNSDGPGSAGTKTISQTIATHKWDFIAFSEDFDYHEELTSAMTDYTFGKWRGTVDNYFSALMGATFDTDGLGFATYTTCSFLDEDWVQFTASTGGISSGANTCIKKGIRHYPVQLTNGVVIDVIITHMNTYSSSGTGHINAQHAQLTQVAEYINTTMAANNRPIIFMGDTNCRYTRHDFNTYFWSKLDQGLTYADPWVDFQWNGIYPTYPSNSLMVSDATNTSNTDIICDNTQQGEVVDKVIYINKASNAVQIKAKSYLRDYDNFKGLGDHMPIVVKFSYEKIGQN